VQGGALLHQVEFELELSMQKILLFTVAMCIGLSSCTWVKLTEDGARVLVRTTVPSDCERLGRTTSLSKAEIANVDRKQTKVATELETLARNYAVGMGGNTIVAQDVMTDDGKQTFIVYNCPQ
jgi:hypothetical protein